jgi:hypothetical protein
VTVLFGGRQEALQTDTWEYDGVSWTKVPVTTAPRVSYRPGDTMAWDASMARCVLVADGCRAAMWEWDGVAWTEDCLPAWLRNLRQSTLTHDDTRGVLVHFGGYWNLDQPSSNETWEH